MYRAATTNIDIIGLRKNWSESIDCSLVQHASTLFYYTHTIVILLWDWSRNFISLLLRAKIKTRTAVFNATICAATSILNQVLFGLVCIQHFSILSTVKCSWIDYLSTALTLSFSVFRYYLWRVSSMTLWDSRVQQTENLKSSREEKTFPFP